MRLFSKTKGQTLREKEEYLAKERKDFGLYQYEEKEILKIDRKKFEWENEALETREKEAQKIIDAKMDGASEMGEYEHEYHSAKQVKGVELAKINAEIDFKKELLDKTKDQVKAECAIKLSAKDEIITELRNQMEQLREHTNVLVSKLVEIDIKGVSLVVDTNRVKNDSKK